MIGYILATIWAIGFSGMLLLRIVYRDKAPLWAWLFLPFFGPLVWAVVVTLAVNSPKVKKILEYPL